MDAFHPQSVFSSIDLGGRYAWGNQPDIDLWNLARFAETLRPLLSGDPCYATKIARTALSRYPERFRSQYITRFRAKLGLPPEVPAETVDECLDLLSDQKKSSTKPSVVPRTVSAS